MTALREAMLRLGFQPSAEPPPRPRSPGAAIRGNPPVRVPHNVRKSVVSYLVRGWTPIGPENDAAGAVAGMAARATHAPGISNAAWSAEAVRHIRRHMLAQNPQSDAHRIRLCRELVMAPPPGRGGA